MPAAATVLRRVTENKLDGLTPVRGEERAALPRRRVVQLIAGRALPIYVWPGRNSFALAGKVALFVY